ncbi:MAG TPA: hypothetical protein VFC63_08620 [Blastocatellia bacterium]|nr:hypothetical protein [Blastocatellia bacterium]
MSVANKNALRRITFWPPQLIRDLRGKRTLAEFASLVNVTPDIVRLWEDDKMRPGEEDTNRLADLAQKEEFLKDWKLAGSGRLLGDVDEAIKKLRKEDEEIFANRIKRLYE